MSIRRFVITDIGVSGSFFRGGQQLHPAKIQSRPAEISSCQGGHVFGQAAVPNFSAKLSCQTVLLMVKLEDKCLKNRQNGRKTGKYGRNQPKVAENRQKWQENWQNVKFYKLSSAKLPFLSCQAPISVLPRSHFCPAKLTNFSRGGQGPPGPPPSYAYAENL